MNILIGFTAIVLSIFLVGHKLSVRKSGYTLLQTLFFAYATKE